MFLWRLIDTGSLPGPDNMAIDEALLRLFDPADSLPILRLYGWSPPALSLGRFQKAPEVLDLERCRADGIAVVRRVTGGGVIYHSDELTYSIVCAPSQIPPASSIKESFRVLTGFLLAFYRSQGLDACHAVDVATDGQRLGERTPFCFAGRESFDILANGRKIGGNAQRRTKGIIFQHGSIPLVNRTAIGLSYLRENSPGQAEGAASLEECGITASREVLLKEIVAVFSGHFGVKLQSAPISERERLEADRLRACKFTKDRWNLEGVDE